jgi:hypothetical protein
LLLTLKQEYHAFENPRPSLCILVKNGCNNEGRGGENVPPRDVCARDVRKEGGGRSSLLLYRGLATNRQ